MWNIAERLAVVTLPEADPKRRINKPPHPSGCDAKQNTPAAMASKPRDTPFRSPIFAMTRPASPACTIAAIKPTSASERPTCLLSHP